jgi:hypothetical protein
LLLFASLSDLCPFLCEWQVAFGSKDLEIISTGETIPISKCMRKKLKEQLWLEYREEHTLEDGTFLGMERTHGWIEHSCPILHQRVDGPLAFQAVV